MASNNCVKINNLYLAILLIIFLPEGLIVNFGISSVSIGFFIASVIGIVLLQKSLNNNRLNIKLFSKFYLGSLVFFLLNFVFGFICNSHFNFLRFFSSYILISLEFFTAFLFGICLNCLSSEEFDRFFKNISLLMLFLGLSVCLYWSFFDHTAKEMFFFTEPSHYSVVSSPFIVYYIISSNKFKAFMFSMILLLVAAFVENMTLLLPVAIAVFILDKRIFIISTLIFLALITVVGTGFGNYILDRYSGVTSGDNQNISSLVYLQGWDYIISSIKQFNGFGIGFQQLGEIRINSDSQDILEYMGYPLNQNDGAFLFSKFFVEFGWIGLFVVLITLFEILVFSFKISKFRNENQYLNIFIGTTYLSFIIPLFVRNSSYFNAAIFIFIAAFFSKMIQEFKCIKSNYVH